MFTLYSLTTCKSASFSRITIVFCAELKFVSKLEMDVRRSVLGRCRKLYRDIRQMGRSQIEHEKSLGRSPISPSNISNHRKFGCPFGMLKLSMS